MEGGDIRDCLRLGNALGAVVASQRGATEPVDPASLERLRAGATPRNIEESLRTLLPN
jgi:sugar/nucleoside kinase (ribokinase family)